MFGCLATIVFGSSHLFLGNLWTRVRTLCHIELCTRSVLLHRLLLIRSFLFSPCPLSPVIFPLIWVSFGRLSAASSYSGPPSVFLRTFSGSFLYAALSPSEFLLITFAPSFFSRRVSVCQGDLLYVIFPGLRPLFVALQRAGVCLPRSSTSVQVGPPMLIVPRICSSDPSPSLPVQSCVDRAPNPFFSECAESSGFPRGSFLPFFRKALCLPLLAGRCCLTPAAFATPPPGWFLSPLLFLIKPPDAFYRKLIWFSPVPLPAPESERRRGRTPP